jgi:hypothetical protein
VLQCPHVIFDFANPCGNTIGVSLSEVAGFGQVDAREFHEVVGTRDWSGEHARCGVDNGSAANHLVMNSIILYIYINMGGAKGRFQKYYDFSTVALLGGIVVAHPE